MTLGRFVDVGAERLVARSLREIDQAGEFLHAEIGVRLQPETIDVLRIFEAQERIVDRRVEGVVNQARDPRDCSASATPRITGKRVTPPASK